jgi:hypothetical protein
MSNLGGSPVARAKVTSYGTGAAQIENPAGNFRWRKEGLSLLGPERRLFLTYTWG